MSIRKGPDPSKDLLDIFQRVRDRVKPAKVKSLFKKPVIIVSTPRSGSTLLFETLRNSNDLWSIGDESHIIYNAFPHLRAENPQFDSGRLLRQHADKETSDLIRAGFLHFLTNREKQHFLDLERKPARIRLLEKTPRNSLNIPFLNKVFPGALFILLHRDPRQNIGSIIEAWDRPDYITFPNLPGWFRQHWHMLLPPGWRALNGKSIADIAAFQWRASNQIMLDDLNALGPARWTSISYTKLIENTDSEIERLCSFCKIPYQGILKSMAASPLPLSSTTFSAPDPEKWKKYEAEINRVLPQVEQISRKLESLP